MKRVGKLLGLVSRNFQADNCLTMGAATSYYALFSLFPLLLVVLGLVGFVLGSVDSTVRQALRQVGQAPPAALEPYTEEVNDQLLEFVRNNISEQTAVQIERTLESLNAGSRQAGLIGIGILFFTASTVFDQLKQAFNIIWRVQEKREVATGWLASVLSVVMQRVAAIGIVLCVAVAMLLAVITHVVQALLGPYTTLLHSNNLFWPQIQFAISLAVLVSLLALLLKYMPDVPVAWGDVWLGALLVGLLFSGLLRLLSWYIASADYQAYGAVGGFMALLLWIYGTSVAIFLGAEFTHAYALTFGSYSRPRVIMVPPEDRPADAPQVDHVPPVSGEGRGSE